MILKTRSLQLIHIVTITSASNNSHCECLKSVNYKFINYKVCMYLYYKASLEARSDYTQVL